MSGKIGLFLPLTSPGLFLLPGKNCIVVASGEILIYFATTTLCEKNG